ncbi:MAG: hypothetical protein JSS30_01000 [Verrucomicrobia bacterium]|nr:hypothetical protein [Verrucomicrobiota bacterium]
MKKKSKLATIAALGLVACSMGQVEAADAPTTECVPPKPADKNKLLSQLDNAHAQMFNAMDCEGQNLALQLANQSCKGKNSCQGLNSCKSKKNSCAGLGACKGQSPGPFKDKNKAVAVANMQMAKKRQAAMDNM